MRFTTVPTCQTVVPGCQYVGNLCKILATKRRVAISRHPLGLRCPNLVCGVYGGRLKNHPKKIQNGRRQTGSSYIAASVGPTMSKFDVWGLWRTPKNPSQSKFKMAAVKPEVGEHGAQWDKGHSETVALAHLLLVFGKHNFWWWIMEHQPTFQNYKN